ncbi:MAG: P1 family peptidase, partial [Bifidobacteriaceae bacterium]|nr:P1 family peptidase [Bifidobacteriaceae bacterium]
MSESSITAVGGFRVGQVEAVGEGWLTGVSVILPPPGTRAAAEIGGAAPATREIAALRPGGATATPHAVVFTGGSSYGLVAAHGVMRFLAGKGVGHRVGPEAGQVVPIVPGAAIYDLGRGGDFSRVPTEQMGHDAAQAAWLQPPGAPVARGSVGAGVGAALDNEASKGGVGSAAAQFAADGSNLTVGAFTVVNAFGVPIEAGRTPLAPALRAVPHPGFPPLNTVLIALATDAELDSGDLARTAAAGLIGLARSIDPTQTLADGDTSIALATGAIRPPAGVWPRDTLIALQATAARVVEAAIADAVASAAEVRTSAVWLR